MSGTIGTWYCIGHNPTRWALVKESGLSTGTPINVAQSLAYVIRHPDGSWKGEVTHLHMPVNEPSREAAMEAAEKILRRAVTSPSQ